MNSNEKVSGSGNRKSSICSKYQELQTVGLTFGREDESNKDAKIKIITDVAFIYKL